jgi:type IV secretory pathway VirB2 component (pilin)
MNKSQLKILFFMLILAAAAPLFATDLVPAGLTNMTTEIIGIFTGGIVKAILICCLAGCAVAYAFNKDNEKMKRNIIAIGIAIVIIIGSTSIVEKIMEASK